MDHNHVMIDLETLGVGPNAAVITIGWCKFTLGHQSEYVAPPHKIQVDVKTCIDRGLVVTDSTFRWWLQQEKGARDALMDTPSISIHEALTQFASEFNGTEYVWGNGANFDVAILETAYNLCGIPIPWKFYNVRCYRTLKSFSAVARVAPQIPHCAASDAEAQAIHLQAIHRDLGF